MAQCLVARGDLYEDHVGGYSRAQKAPRTSSRRTYCSKREKKNDNEIEIRYLRHLRFK